MSVVLDASAAVTGLLNDGPARQLMAREALHVPHLADNEVASVMRRHVAGGRVDAAAGWAALATWRRLGVSRYAATGLLGRVWELRENLTADDATYVALDESLACPLVTGDARLSRAPGIGCPVTLIRS